MTLTAQQQAALDALFPPAASTRDWLSPWLGMSAPQLVERLRALGAKRDAVVDAALAQVDAHPLDAVMSFVSATALAFYRAEHGHNKKINTYTDAFYYISTCISVGYANIFAETQRGRAIAALAMIVGPALAARALDRRTPMP
jgi:hypothetical protein